MRKRCFSSQPPRLLSEIRALDANLVSFCHEKQFLAMEDIPIDGGQLSLDPWPTSVQTVKFGTDQTQENTLPHDFERNMAEDSNTCFNGYSPRTSCRVPIDPVQGARYDVLFLPVGSFGRTVPSKGAAKRLKKRAGKRDRLILGVVGL